MIIKKRNDDGWALVTVILISALMLSVTALVLSKTLTASKDVLRAKTLNKTDAIVDAVTSNVIGWINSRSWGDDPSTTEVKEVSLNLHLNGIDFIKNLYGTSNANLLTSNTTAKLTATTESYIDPDLKTGSDIDITKNYYLNDFLNNKTNRTLNFLSGGSLSKMNSFVVATANTNSTFSTQTGGKWGINELSEKIYRKFNIEYGEGADKIKAEARVSIIPISTSINGLSDLEMHANAGTTSPNIALIPPHDDIYKMTTKVCIPDCTNPMANKKIEMIVNRPIVIGGKIPPFGVYADGGIDLQNKSTASGTTLTISDTHEGDVHSNTNVVVAGGTVSGKVTSAGTVTVGGTLVPDTGIPATGHTLSTTSQIYNKPESKSHVDEIPKPDWDFTPYPATECSSTAGWSLSPKVIKDCKITGNHSLSGEEHFEGKVYITGDLDSKGSDDFAATGSIPVQVIVDGQINLGGNSDGLSTQEVIFVSNYSGTPGCAETMSCPDAVKIAGNPGTGTTTGAVFYTSSPNANVQINGNVSFFGAVIASGTVESVGSSGIIKRDTDLSNLSKILKPGKESLMMKITSWKEVPVNTN